MSSDNIAAAPAENAALQRTKMIMAVCGECLHCYDFDEQRWLDGVKHPIQNFPLCALLHDRKVYVATYTENTIHVYDTLSGAWTLDDFQLQHADTERGAVAMMDGGRICVVGGYQLVTDKRLHSADMFAVQTKRWQALEPMWQARSSCSAIALDDRLYVVGGYTSKDDEKTTLATAERYDAATGTWQRIASLTEPRFAAGIATLDGKLYAMGGYDGGTRHNLKSAEMYDPQSNAWHRVPDMAIARWRPAVVAHAGELYVMGGSDDTRVEVFCPATNVWRWMGASMPGRCTAACLLDKPV